MARVPEAAAAGRAARRWPLVLLVGLAGAVVVVLFSTQKATTAGSLLAGPILLWLAALSGNARQFFLWGLVVTTPMEFSKFFMTRVHQGGEYAFRIEVSDLFLALLAGWWVADQVRRRSWSIALPRPARWWIALIVMALGTVALGSFRVVAAMEVVRMTKLLLLFLLIANTVSRRRQFSHVLAALIACLLLQAVYGLLQYAVGFQFGLTVLGESKVLEESIGGASRRRIGAMLGHPNIFSGFLAMALPVAIALLFTRLRPALRAVCALASLLGASCLVLTLSRNGWLAFAVALLCLLVLVWMHARLRARTILLRTALVATVLVIGIAAAPRILERIRHSDPTSVSARWELNAIALQMIRDKPVFGFGKNATAYAMVSDPRYHLRVKELSLDPEIIPPIHNIYLQQWVEQGTVGLLVFVAMLVSVLRVGVANLRLRDETMYSMNAGLLAGIVAILVHGLADWPFWWNGLTRMFWLYAALLVAIHYWMRRGEPEDPRPAAAAGPRT